MICIDFCVIYKYREKQLMIFERKVAAASDFKNCTMVNCGKITEICWLIIAFSLLQFRKCVNRPQKGQFGKN